MFCDNCGSQIPEGANHCPNCGKAVASPIQNVSNSVGQTIDEVERQMGSAVQDVHQTFVNGGASYPGERLKTDRGLLSYILLTIITCGIYSWYFIYKIAHDINIACEGDGEKTSGLVTYILLSIVTCGVYSWIWYYKLGNRLANNAPRYNLSFQENGTSVLLWMLFGSLLCGIGPFIALNILIKNSNAICMGYNKSHGLI